MGHTQDMVPNVFIRNSKKSPRDEGRGRIVFLILVILLVDIELHKAVGQPFSSVDKLMNYNLKNRSFIPYNFHPGIILNDTWGSSHLTDLSHSTETPFMWYDPPFELVLGYITGSEKHPGITYLPPGQLISGAITYAVQKVNENPHLLSNTTLRFVIAETHGNEIESLHQTALLIHRNISAIIGPQETCVHEARLAAAFNVPMISYVSKQMIDIKFLLKL
ncbi:guanylate cyclase [Plakobranchus ocellatus]|uniref:Guanylate cyclase n=1 Tax=Plakobranchus ocellatus TaxID=259542 RepID=A0AAV4C469_9GAST|nr:guanylate cyclase [Plakobranchus ocellatus]